MTSLHTRLAQRGFALGAWVALGLSAAACNAAQAGEQPDGPPPDEAVSSPEVGLVTQAGVLEDIAATCGLVCPGGKNSEGQVVKGVAEGNAAITGMASVDAFFGAVIRFQNVSGSVAGGIKAELDAIKADFAGYGAADADVVARVDAAIKANVEGSVTVEAEPARCEVDVRASLQAKARCEGEVNPPMVDVSCKGSCEMDVSAEVKCDASADLECTVVPPDLKCSGSCQGTCEVDVMAKAGCTGTCRGTCSGNCSAYVRNASGQAECAGSCEGNCTGKCETELSAAAKCDGSCKGECTLTNPMAGCMGAVRAQCKAKGDASLMCKGKCEGEVTPPSAKVECQASAKAEASMNVECTPPRVSVRYKLKAGIDATARAKFEAKLKTLIDVRLPALKAKLAKADSVAKAGAGLTASAGGALKTAFKAGAKAQLQTQFMLGCALAELDDVGGIIKTSTDGLNAQVSAAAKLNTLLKI